MPPGYGVTEKGLEDALIYNEDHMKQDQDDGGDCDDDVRPPPRNTPVDAELNGLLASLVRLCPSAESGNGITRG